MIVLYTMPKRIFVLILKHYKEYIALKIMWILQLLTVFYMNYGVMNIAKSSPFLIILMAIADG